MWPFRFAMRRKRGLPHMVAYLLSSSPKNGVELMDGVESITRGWWRPTPGSIYPLLKEMTDQGVVRKLEDGRYELTPKGRAQAEVPFGGHSRRSPTTDEIVGQMSSLVSYMEDIKTGDKQDLSLHKETLRVLSKRLADLAEEEDSSSHPSRTKGDQDPKAN